MGLAASKSQHSKGAKLEQNYKYRDGYLRRSTKYNDDVELGVQPLPKILRCSSYNNCQQLSKYSDRGYNIFRYDFDYSEDNFWLHDDTDTVAGNISPMSNQFIVYAEKCVQYTKNNSNKRKTKITMIFCNVKINKIKMWRKNVYKTYNEKILQKWYEFCKHFDDNDEEKKMKAQKRYNDERLKKVWQDIWEQQDLYAYHNNYIHLYYNQW